VTIRVQLDAVVREMVSKGILYEDACIEFERRFITYALAEEAGSIGRAAERIGMHRNTFSRKMDEHGIKKS
jgi:DNA-binding NtrC family response regulator